MQRLSPNETLLEGQWLNTDDQIVSNEACARIEWLTTDILKLVRVDRSTWLKLYQDPLDKRYWLLYYPQTELHGGGPPSLMAITYEEADLRFKKQNV